ncbi:MULTISPECIES: amino acid ABC transporter ATP-binding/permease protein [unclassified Janthinobacterium]|uniref:amino acid ABC transporter ATP-binding/permease protein n=1 Tax=unclassified Janthinobacterium TaxID=2610881 RepID=UPI001620B9EC|nr:MULTISPECIES: ATP-binding cassette domain-containing protein [unclassified Janthinobacterium]MBB5366759.1 ATP-binding cassette subfamily C protein CydC [Janthinobacterium sp. K2C7]MBB5380763.1 ATP-binding cassette subfamily C protein CydC [Janthinobacterium sp. K2Li3]MBB5385141.1 ATP-binding cassette subfamily C protein CydC [Janthinobacterium sp. K2E3]
MKSLFFPLNPVLRQLLLAQPGKLVAGAVLAALTVIAGMALLGLSGWFITATSIAGLHASTALMFDVFGPSAGIRLLAIGRTGSRYAERLVTHDATFAALATIRVDLFRGWSLPEAGKRLLRQPAKLLFRLTADIDALESLYLRLIVPAFTALCAALLAAVALGFMQISMGVVFAVWLLLSGGGISALLIRRAQRHAIVRSRATEQLRSATIDLVAGQTDLVMAGRIGAQCDVLAGIDGALARADLELNRLETRAAAAYSIAGAITLAGVLLAVAALVDSQAITVPVAALGVLIALTAVEPFASLRRGALEAGRMLLAVRRLGPRVASAGSTAPDAEVTADVRFEQVSAAHAGSDMAIVHGVSLTVAAGERVALIGPSGAGKSTLLAVAAREIAALAGNYSGPRACLFTQRTELFQDSVRDNLRLADPQADDGRLWEALRAAGLEAEVQAMTGGLDTRLGEGGLGLSGGQSRRLALARLFLHESPLWLLDEATEALNAATAHDVLVRLAARCEGRTLLIATHLRREAALADRLISIRHGRVNGDVRRGTVGFEAALQSLRAD